MLHTCGSMEYRIGPYILFMSFVNVSFVELLRPFLESLHIFHCTESCQDRFLFIKTSLSPFYLQCIKSIGPLEHILNTPAHHRVHHGRNRYCIDKNYAGTLIIWDRMFGKEMLFVRSRFKCKHTFDIFGHLVIQIFERWSSSGVV